MSDNPALWSSELKDELEKAEAMRVNLYIALADQTIVIKTPGSAPAAASFSLALSHLHALGDLVKLGHRGSALALLRPLFESAVRGCWFLVATDDQVQKVSTLGYTKPFDSLVTTVDKSVIGANKGILLAYKKKVYAYLSDLAHGGPLAVAHQLSDGSVGESIADSVVASALALARQMMVFVAVGYGHLITDEAVISNICAAAEVHV